MVRLEYASLRLEFELDNEGNIVDSMYHTICIDELDMDDEIQSMLDTIKGGKFLSNLECR